MELEGKIALVTGAGWGMGKAIALKFAQEGADVVVNDIKSETAEATALEIKTLGRRPLPISADVSKEDEVSRMVEHIINEWGGIDILVNNAGIGYARMAEDLTADQWHHILGVNLDGPFYCSKAVIETMKRRGGGKIVNISSLAARKMSLASCPSYTASKAGLVGLTRHLAFELGPYKINVNAICPGFTLTGKGKVPNLESAKVFMEKNPLKDVCRPEDIAEAALFFASNRSRMITGSILDIDGGEFLSGQNWDNYMRRRKNAFEKDEPAH
ncbi:MAG: SDR family oxidoreductase [Deltaproteobacteria bacterium]|nr:SDR family oxidoreductase [Deltaproteobacteria bacterium]